MSNRFNTCMDDLLVTHLEVRFFSLMIWRLLGVSENNRLNGNVTQK